MSNKGLSKNKLNENVVSCASINFSEKFDNLYFSCNIFISKVLSRLETIKIRAIISALKINTVDLSQQKEEPVMSNCFLEVLSCLNINLAMQLYHRLFGKKSKNIFDVFNPAAREKLRLAFLLTKRTNISAVMHRDSAYIFFLNRMDTGHFCRFCFFVLR